MKNIVTVIFIILLIFSVSAYSAVKEYSLKRCESEANSTGITSENCDKCIKNEDIKVRFKVSKALGSVMQTTFFKDGSNHSAVIDNCKIFDDDTFECKTETEARIYDAENFIRPSYSELRLSNGKWEKIYLSGGSKFRDFYIPPSHSYVCGFEINIFFDIFK